MRVPMAIALVLSAGAATAQSPQDYAYGASLEADGSEALYQVALPAAVYRVVAHPDLADVRVFNGAGQVVPHAWRPRRSDQVDSLPPVPLTLFPLRATAGTDVDEISIRLRRDAAGRADVVVTSSGGRSGTVKRTVAYLADLTKVPRPLRALALEWESRPDGFAGRLRVDGSDDLDAWRTLVAAASLVRLEIAGQRLDQKRIELPPDTARYLRLSWVSEQSEEPPELSGARGEPVGRTVDPAREWIRVKAEPGPEPGEYVFDLGGHFPVDRVRVGLSEPNTVAQVEWLVRDEPEAPWRRVASRVVYRLRRPDGEITSPAVPIPVSTERHWLLRVDQRGGGVGVEAPTLEAGWVPDALVFAARGEPPFQLAYGNREARPAAHAIETLIPDVEAITVSNTRILEPRTLGGDARLVEGTDWKRWSLWASLLLGVVILGLMAWRLARQMDTESGSRSQ
jgi:hypothetical protein